MRLATQPPLARRPWLRLAAIPLLGLVALAAPVRAAERSLPFVLPAGNEALEGFVRIVNRSDRSGEVEIRAVDDAGKEFGPISLSIGADSSRHFNSEDLESGNTDKGLSDGVGDGQCNWRLELETDLDILPLAFVRTGDGFVTSIHDVVPEVEPGRHDVAIFNPGKNMAQQSRLRLVNRGEVEARVEVEGTDDGGTRSEGKVELTVPARGACTLTSDELESGEAKGDCACEVSGALGAGTGKWQLSVTTEQSTQVMSVLKTPEHLTNLSTVEYAGFAPVDADAFKERFVGRRVRATDNSGYIDFVSARRFRELFKGRTYGGSHTYENASPNSATIIFRYDDGDVCTVLAAFDSFIAATALSVCEDGVTEELELQPLRSWSLEDIGTAPGSQSEFDDIVAARQLAPGSGFGAPVVFTPPGQFSQGAGGAARTGSYTYVKTGRNSGRVRLSYAGGGHCTLDLTFNAATSGSLDYACSDISNMTTEGLTNWTLERVAESVGLAPADQAAFHERFRDKRVVSALDPQGASYYLDILSPTGFREFDFGSTYDGTYTYAKTGADSADIALAYEDGDHCDVALTFRSETSGSANFVCMYGGTNTVDWRAVDR